MAKLTGKPLEIANEIKAVLAKHGFAMAGFRWSIDDRAESEGRISLGWLRTVADGPNMKTADDAARERFQALARVYNLDPSWLGDAIKIGNHEYKITGMMLRRSFKRFTLERQSDKKRFTCTADQILQAKRRSA